MAGTNELPPNQQYGVILERLKVQDNDNARLRGYIESMSKVLEEIRIDKATAYTNFDNGIKNVGFRLDREELARAEETRQRIAVNTDHNLLIRTIGQQAADDLAKQNAKHEAEIASLKRTLEVLPGILLTNRILIALTSATVISVISAVVTGRIAFVFNP